MLGLSDHLAQTVFVYLCICICVFGCQTLGNIVFVKNFLRSLYHFLFKNISHHGSFQVFTAPELCGANKWIGFGLVGVDGMGSLCGVII